MTVGYGWSRRRLRGLTLATVSLVVGLPSAQELASASVQRPPQLKPSDSPSAVTCVLRSAEAPPQHFSSLPSSLRCPEKPSVLSCDFENAEPFDVPLGPDCRLDALAVRRAVPVVLDVGTAQWVTIEWLQWLPPSTRPSVLATRRLTTDRGRVVVLVDSDQVGRFVRIRADAGAPVTIAGPVAKGSGPVRLELQQPGGALFVLLARSDIEPSHLMLRAEDGSTIRLPRIGNAFIRQGLAPGTHEITPVFDGGVEGRTQSVTIVESHSSDVLLPREDMGGIALAVGDGLCESTTQIDLLGPVRPVVPPAAAVVRPRLTRSLGESCDLRLGGLYPGRHQLILAQGARTARESVTIADGTWTDVELDWEAVAIAGKVTLNQEPANGLALDFLRHGTAKPVEVPLQEDGTFFSELPGSGTYVVNLKTKGGRASYLGQSRSVQLSGGRHRLDLEFSGTTLELTLDGWDRRTPVSLSLRLPAGGTARFDFQPSAPFPLRVPALSPGSYVAAVRQFVSMGRLGDRGKISAEETLVVPEGGDLVRLRLRLDSNHSVLEFVGPDRRPVPDARLRTSSADLIPVATGRFLLEGVAPGAPVRVRAPGFSPVCLAAPASGDHFVDLDVGQPIVLRFDKTLTGLTGIPLGIATMPCTLDLGRDFDVRTLSGPDQTTLEIKAFPAVDSFTLQWAGQLITVTISSGRVASVNLPKRD